MNLARYRQGQVGKGDVDMGAAAPWVWRGKWSISGAKAQVGPGCVWAPSGGDDVGQWAERLRLSSGVYELVDIKLRRGPCRHRGGQGGGKACVLKVGGNGLLVLDDFDQAHGP